MPGWRSEHGGRIVSAHGDASQKLLLDTRDMMGRGPRGEEPTEAEQIEITERAELRGALEVAVEPKESAAGCGEIID